MHDVIMIQKTWTTIVLVGIQIFYASSQDIVPKFPIYYTNSSDDHCHTDSLLLEQGLKENVLWAMQMWDSSVKSGVGIVSGTLLQYGDYDECLAVKEPITAKYCLLTVTLLKPSNYNSTDPYTIDYSPYVPFWEKLNDRGIVSKQKNNVIDWALCVPSSCREYDILLSLNEFILQENLNSSISLSFSERACSQTGDNKFTFGDLAFCFVTIIYVIFLILVTTYDFKKFEGVEETPSNGFLCFSLRRSFNSLMKPTPPINKYNLDMLSGLYIIPMYMIVLGHRFGMFQVGGMSNYHFVEKAFKYTEFSMWTGHIDIVVNCFFTLSGFMTGMLLPFYYENLKPNIFKVLLNRYIRLASPLLAVIFFYATIFNKTGDGPIWNSTLYYEKENCVDNWWTTILFIGNYVNSEKYCMVHTWYIFCDLQLFVLVTIIFYFGKNHPAIIKFIISMLIVSCIAASFYGTYAWNLTAFSLFYKRSWENIHKYNYFKTFYIKTHFKGAPYLVGFITGYTLYLRKPNKLSKGETKSLLLGGALIMFMAYTSGSLFSDPAHFRLGFPSALYASLCNVFWATGMLMIMIALLIGSANIILKLFSWSFLVPLSKLTYNGYLVHMTFQIHSAASRRTPAYISISEWVSRTISDLVLVFFVAFLLNIAVESPVRYFVKYLIYKKERTKENIAV